MILKTFELSKNNIDQFKFFLLYGENEGLKEEIINKIKKNQNGKEIKYEEAQILKSKSEFYNEIKNKSLFDEKRIFFLERCTEKISELLIEIFEDTSDDIFIINCSILEKKSKLRNYAERSSNVVVIPTYKDNSQSLINIARKFFNEEKISISAETLNLLVNRCMGDRGILNKELDKISNYISEKKIISLKEIAVLTNLSENYSASELVDASLTKNYIKVKEILNENIYSQEDTFLILRVFLQKAKKLLSLLEIINSENNVEKAINEYKPPIFWKDKPVLKKQLQLWSFENIINLICELNDIEIKIKKNNSKNLILMKNFIYEILDRKTSNSFL